MPWAVRTADVTRLQGQGNDFARLVNDLLAAHLTAAGVPLDGLRTTDNSDAPDGGVDAEVGQSLLSAGDPTGLFAALTVWQYKARASGGVTTRGGQQAALRLEVHKPRVRDRLAAGSAYRLCLADSLTPQQQARWEGWLAEAVREVAPDAPSPRVITADRLADWLSRFPALVRRLRPDLVGVDILGEWAGRERHLAPSYVTVAAWEGVRRAVRRHADLTASADGAVLAVAGEAGVGKTRLVLEAVGEVPGVAGLLVHTDDRARAVELVDRLTRDPGAQAVVVIDECPVATRQRLQHLTAPHAARLRVIAIDNQGDEPTAGSGELRLERPDRAAVGAVLEANCPALHMMQRHAIADATGGVVRLALDVARNLHRLGPAGDTGLLAADFRDRILPGTAERRPAAGGGGARAGRPGGPVRRPGRPPTRAVRRGRRRVGCPAGAAGDQPAAASAGVRGGRR